MLAKSDRSGRAASTARPELDQALSRCRTALAGIGFFSLFVNALMLTGPLFMMQVYDRVLTSRSVPTLIALIGLVAALYGFMGVLNLVRSRVLARIGSQLDHDLKPRTFGIWVTGGLLGRQAPSQPLSDLQALRQFLAGTGPIALFDLPWVPIYLGIIFLLHWTLGLVALVGALAIFVIALINEFLTRAPLEQASRLQLHSTSFAQLCRRNAEAVIAMGMGRHVKSRWFALQGEAAAHQLRASDRAGGTTAVSKSFRLFLQSANSGCRCCVGHQPINQPWCDDRCFDHHGASLGADRSGYWPMAVCHWRPSSLDRLSAQFDAAPPMAERDGPAATQRTSHGRRCVGSSAWR